MQNRFKKWWSGVQESYYVGQNYDEGRWWFKYYCALYSAFGWNWLVSLLCKMLGHKWVEEVFSPEDGGTDLYCARCGENHRVWMR